MFDFDALSNRMGGRTVLCVGDLLLDGTVAVAAEEKMVLTAVDLDVQLKEWRGHGSRIGFSNGCFDILHPVFSTTSLVGRACEGGA